MNYRIGKKQKLAVLDRNGVLIVMFNKGQEELAQKFVDLLNGTPQLQDIVRKIEDVYICSMLDGNKLIATQSKAIPDLFHNMADAYNALTHEKII
ncbi:MAG: hypothetical protein QG594_1777 [Bacteroidota bacterium]|nr:hypothetical protein [Bacteroidota bacterium]